VQSESVTKQGRVKPLYNDWQYLKNYYYYYYFSISYIRSACATKNGTFATLQMLERYNIDVMFGPVCSGGKQKYCRSNWSGLAISATSVVPSVECEWVGTNVRNKQFFRNFPPPAVGESRRPQKYLLGTGRRSVQPILQTNKLTGTLVAVVRIQCITCDAKCFCDLTLCLFHQSINQVNVRRRKWEKHNGAEHNKHTKTNTKHEKLECTCKDKRYQVLWEDVPEGDMS